MARSWTEEAIMRKMQALIMTYADNVSMEDFCSDAGINEDVYAALMHMNRQGSVWSPREVYRLWDAMAWPPPKMEM